MKTIISKITNLTPKQILKIWLAVYLLFSVITIYKNPFGQEKRTASNLIFDSIFIPVFFIFAPFFGALVYFQRIIGYLSYSRTCNLNFDPHSQLVQIIVFALCLTLIPSLVKHWRKASGCIAIFVTVTVFFYLSTYLILNICFSLPIK